MQKTPFADFGRARRADSAENAAVVPLFSVAPRGRNRQTVFFAQSRVGTLKNAICASDGKDGTVRSAYELDDNFPPRGPARMRVPCAETVVSAARPQKRAKTFPSKFLQTGVTINGNNFEGKMKGFLFRILSV